MRLAEVMNNIEPVPRLAFAVLLARETLSHRFNFFVSVRAMAVHECFDFGGVSGRPIEIEVSLRMSVRRSRVIADVSPFSFSFARDSDRPDSHQRACQSLHRFETPPVRQVLSSRSHRPGHFRALIDHAKDCRSPRLVDVSAASAYRDRRTPPV